MIIDKIVLSSLLENITTFKRNKTVRLYSPKLAAAFKELVIYKGFLTGLSKSSLKLL